MAYLFLKICIPYMPVILILLFVSSEIQIIWKLFQGISEANKLGKLCL